MSYLTNRYQQCIYNDVISDKLKVITGVPQGTILGPILFLIYINDITKSSSLCKFTMFADDTTLYFENTSAELLNYICQTELKNINKWLIYNRLSLNLNKTCFMSINSRTIININLNNRNIERVTFYKFLGVIIDDILNWKQHILFLKSKLKKIIWITNIISKFINKKALLHIYNSIFLPHIKYCNIFWGNTYKSNVSCIYILQKRMIRIICKKHFLHHTNGLFIDNSLLKINEITYI